MPLEPDFLELMTETVAVESRTATSSYGKETFGGSASYRARIERRTRLARSADGQERTSGCQVYLYGAPQLDVHIRVTLPDTTQPEVLAVNQSKDAGGDDYYTEIMLA